MQNQIDAAVSHFKNLLEEQLKRVEILGNVSNGKDFANADKIVVLDDGRISEQGSPEELLAQNGLFKKMVDLQNLSGEWVI